MTFTPASVVLPSTPFSVNIFVLYVHLTTVLWIAFWQLRHAHDARIMRMSPELRRNMARRPSGSLHEGMEKPKELKNTQSITAHLKRKEKGSQGGSIVRSTILLSYHYL